MSTLVKDYDRFAKEAQAICKDRVYTDRLRRYAYGVDASCYSYLPKVVVKAENESEVRRLIRLCQQCGTPFTFRAWLQKNGSYRRWQSVALRMWCYWFRCK